MSETLDASPGFVMDMYLLRQRYDDEQHFIKRMHECEREAEE